MEDVLDISKIDISDIDVSIEKSRHDFVFIDLQGFKHYRGRFMCKEFCLVDEDYMYHAIVRANYHFHKMIPRYQRQVNWLIKNYHGLTFYCGDTYIDDLREKVFPKIQNKKILVKGDEKVKWLQYIFRHYGTIDCSNIENLDFDLTLRNADPYENCDYHTELFGHDECPCAMSNALKLQDIVLKNLK